MTGLFPCSYHRARPLGPRSRLQGGSFLFTYSDHVCLPALDLALDPPRRARYAFVSHGHSDHVARHDGGIASPATVALVARRYGRTHLTPVAFGETIERARHRVTLQPAGHILGAAQVIIDAPDGRRLIYTGDFSVRARRTVEPAVPVHADILIMECTYGHPRYVFPPDEEIQERIRSFIERTLAAEQIPVLLGYSLGKAQEAMAIVAALGYPVCVHPAIGRLAEIYRAFGIDLGSYIVADGTVPEGYVVIAPPGARRLPLPRPVRTLLLSGWALDPSTPFRLGVDEAVPLSDHADFAELVAFVRASRPARVYTTHGPPSFADYLRDLGFDAYHLGTYQLPLF